MNSSHDILLVEDDHDIAWLLGHLLRRDGHSVRHAASAAQAMQMLHDGWRPALFILDLVMPEMDGLQLLRWLRGERGLSEPVLVLTASLQQGLAQQLQQAGADAVGHKPLDIHAIRRLIAGLLD